MKLPCEFCGKEISVAMLPVHRCEEMDKHDTPQWKAWIDAVEKLAFSMPAPNVYTPQFVQLCVEARSALLQSEISPIRTRDELKAEITHGWDDWKDTGLGFYDGAPEMVKCRMSHERGFTQGYQSALSESGTTTNAEHRVGMDGPNMQTFVANPEFWTAQAKQPQSATGEALDAARFRWIAAHRDQFKAMLADDNVPGNEVSAMLEAAMDAVDSSANSKEKS